MTQQRDAFLAGLAALAPTTVDSQLDADAVNRLGTALGLSGPDILAAIEALKAEGFVDLHWGPALSLTPKGRRRAAGEPETGTGPTLAAGAVFVNGPVGDHANVGTGAGAKNSTVAVGSTVSIGVSLGELAAALSQLQGQKASLPTDALPVAEKLERELSEAVAAAKDAQGKPEAEAKPAVTRLAESVDRGTKLLGAVEQAGGKIAGVGHMLSNAYDAIAPYLSHLQP